MLFLAKPLQTVILKHNTNSTNLGLNGGECSKTITSIFDKCTCLEEYSGFNCEFKKANNEKVNKFIVDGIA